MQPHNCPWCGRDLSGTLTAREAEVLILIAQGYTNRGIALTLHISRGNARNHVSSVIGKLQAQSRANAIAIAYQRGLLPLTCNPT